jgi:hypothetical protein
LTTLDEDLAELLEDLTTLDEDLAELLDNLTTLEELNETGVVQIGSPTMTHELLEQTK